MLQKLRPTLKMVAELIFTAKPVVILKSLISGLQQSLMATTRTFQEVDIHIIKLQAN